MNNDTHNDTAQKLAASAIDAILAASLHDPLTRDVLTLMPTVRKAFIRSITTAYGTGLATGATLARAGMRPPKATQATPAPDAGRE